ncbi:MAG: flagellar biosynthesis anti-sigma factor FlgM [Actinomycetota bacterium]
MTSRSEERRDERRERVNTVKENVGRGEYRVPAETVADAIISWYRRDEIGQVPTQT